MNYRTPNSGKNATVFRPFRTIASHEGLHELLTRRFADSEYDPLRVHPRKFTRIILKVFPGNP